MHQMVSCALIFISLCSAGKFCVGIPTYFFNGIVDLPSILNSDVLLGSYYLNFMDTLYLRYGCTYGNLAHRIFWDFFIG